MKQEDAEDRPDLTYGVANSLLIAIPLWVLIGAVLVLVFQDGPISESASLAFMVAAIVEIIVARYAYRSLWPALWRRRVAVPSGHAHGARKAALQAVNRSAKSSGGAIAYLEEATGKRIVSIMDLLRLVAAPPPAKPAGRPARIQSVRRSTLRHTASFAALSIAFLQYYFWDVGLQIASLNSITVFVAVTPLLKVAT